MYPVLIAADAPADLQSAGIFLPTDCKSVGAVFIRWSSVYRGNPQGPDTFQKFPLSTNSSVLQNTWL